VLVALTVIGAVCVVVAAVIVYGEFRWNKGTTDATLEDGDVSVTLLFRFGEDGLIDIGRAEARGRLVGAVLELCHSRWHARPARR
jgi:hypothetical protein